MSWRSDGDGRGVDRLGWHELLALGAVSLVALAARLYRIGDDPLWYDEAASVAIAGMDWSTIFGPMAAAESSPPGYYAAAKIWTLVFGSDVATLRLLSAAVGVAALLPVWLLARSGFGARAAWLAVAALALAGSHVRLSQDARSYPLLFLCTCWSMLAAWRILQSPRAGIAASWWPSIVLGFGMGLSLWLHATAAIIAVSLNAFVLAGALSIPGRFRPAIVRLVVADVVALAIATGPILAILGHVLNPGGFVDRWIVPPTLYDTMWLYGRTLVGPYTGLFAPLAVLLHLMLLSSAALAWWWYRNPLVAALVAMLATGALLLPLISQVWPVLLDRTALFLLAPLIVLVAGGASRLPKQWYVVSAAVLLVIQLAGTVGWHRVETRKERWDLAAAALSARLVPGDVVVLTEGVLTELSLVRHLRLLGTVLPSSVVVVPSTDLEQLLAAHLASGRVTPPGGVCGRLGASRTAWLVMRELPDKVRDDLDFSARGPVLEAFRAAGGTMDEAIAIVGVEIERWLLPAC